jgi:hypothetical protein
MPGAIEFAGNGPGRNGKRNFYDNCLNCGWGPRVGFAYQMPDRLKMTVRGGYGIFYAPRIPNGWSGVPWGNKLGFTATNTVNAPTPASGVQLGQRLHGSVKTATNPSAAAPSGAVSWDPDGAVSAAQQWNYYSA